MNASAAAPSMISRVPAAAWALRCSPKEEHREHDRERTFKIEREGSGDRALGAPSPVSATDFTVTGVAASPVGDVLAVVGVRETATPRRSRVVAYRLDSSGAPLGPEIIVDTAAYGDNDHLPMTHPDVGFDYDGDMYIVWDDATRGSAGVCVGAFDAGGYPPPRA